MAHDTENPYAASATTSQSNATAQQPRIPAVTRLSIGVLAINILTVAGISMGGYYNRDPLNIPMGEAMVCWAVAGVPISSVCVLVYSATIDRRTAHSLLRIVVSIACLALWTGLAAFTINSLKQHRMRLEREYEQIDWQEQLPGPESVK